MKLEARLAATVGAITLGFTVADLIWSRQSNVSLDPRSYIEFAKVIVALGILYWMMNLVQGRVDGDQSRAARFIDASSAGVKTLIANTSLFIPLGFASVYFMYLIAATTKPLMDDALAVFDISEFGFSWRDFLAYANANPSLAKVLVIAYHSVGPQMPVLFLLLAFTRQGHRLLEFMAMLAVSSALTAAIMANIPAAGAYAYFQPVAADYSNFTAHAGMWHFTELTKLRSGEPFSLLVTQAEGLATFPSYHTALGIMITYAVRSMPVIAIPVGILNALMIVATLPEGGHHLSDVLAGAAIGILTLACVRALAWRGFDMPRRVPV